LARSYNGALLNFAHAVKNCATISSVRCCWPSAPKKLVSSKKQKKKCTMYIKLGLLWAARRDACVRKIIHLYVYQRVYPLKLFNKSKSKRNKNQEKKKNELKSEQQIPWDRKKIARTATIKA